MHDTKPHLASMPCKPCTLVSAPMPRCTNAAHAPHTCTTVQYARQYAVPPHLVLIVGLPSTAHSHMRAHSGIPASSAHRTLAHSAKLICSCKHAGGLLLEHPREPSLRIAVRGHVDGHEERDYQPVHRQGRCAALDQHHADVHFGDVRRLVLGRLGNGPNARIA